MTKRLDVHKDETTSTTIMVPDEQGDYLRYDDVMALLDSISKCDTNMSPKEAVISSIIDWV